MPLVFVHGVANRRGTSEQDRAQFDEHVKARDGLFRSIAFADRVQDGTTLHIENPYWGDFGATFAWELASVPKGNVEAMGAEIFATEVARRSEAGRLAQVAVATTTGKAAAASQEPTTILLTLAREATLSHAVDALVAAALQRDPVEDGPDPASVAAFAARAIAYAEANPSPGWLKTVQDDAALILRLIQEVTPAEAVAPAPVEALGGLELLGFLSSTGRRLGNAAKDLFTGMADGAIGAAGGLIGDATEPLIRKFRPAVSSMAGVFLGDVFVYLKHREVDGKPGPIANEVIKAIDDAIKAKKPGDDKLSIIAHSMGGQVVYDVLTHFRPDVQCDLLITAGAQVSLFEELKLHRSSDPDIKAGATKNVIARPSNIHRWINVFDLTDVIGFTNSGIFEGVDNFAFDNGTLPIVSHGAYFDGPRFHERLRARIAKAFGGGA